MPIFKKGDNNNPDNYRGITLTSIIGKVYTHILNRRLSKWAQRERIVVEEQAGFREGYSTVDHIFTLYALVQKHLNNNTKLYVAFVDFHKAFDSINRNKLWNILRNNGVNGRLYRAIRGVYNTVIACVRDRNMYTNCFPCPKGVKQGCVLSPLLFSFFINELAVDMTSNGKHGIQMVPGYVELFLMLFADDIILLSSTPIGLQHQLNVLKQNADRLSLNVNLEKTNIIVFRKGGYLSINENWKYGDSEVKVTNSYKYLGLTFTTKLSLTAAWSEMCRKGKRGTIEILRAMRNLNSNDQGLYWKLFNTQIEPMITYAAEIWGLSDNQWMERVHLFAIKRFLSVPLHASNKMAYGETGRYPLKIRTIIKSIKYWLKLIKLPSSRLCKQAYEMLLRQHERGNKNWVDQVKNVLTQNGFGLVWITQEVGNDNVFISEFKDRLICSYKQNWHAALEENSKYQWYSSFKSYFQPEKYLTIIQNKWQKMSSCSLPKQNTRIRSE